MCSGLVQNLFLSGHPFLKSSLTLMLIKSHLLPWLLFLVGFHLQRVIAFPSLLARCLILFKWKVEWNLRDQFTWSGTGTPVIRNVRCTCIFFFFVCPLAVTSLSGWFWVWFVFVFFLLGLFSMVICKPGNMTVLYDYWKITNKVSRKSLIWWQLKCCSNNNICWIQCPVLSSYSTTVYHQKVF